MNLVFLGPPGAGKGTQAAAIVEQLHVPQISTGDIIRQAIREQTELGQEFQRYTEKGGLVPDRLVNEMVGQRLTREDCGGGFLLDGFPRTIIQAEALSEMLEAQGRKLDRVLLLDVPDATLLERVTGRRTDRKTGDVYHLRYNPPPVEVMDRLVQRKDDTAEVLKERLVEYHAKTAPLIPFYQKSNLLRRIDGSGSIVDIRQRILAALRD
jgi:adenylate kinase